MQITCMFMNKKGKPTSPPGYVDPIFGPCEPLIQIVMSASKHNYLELIILTGVFSIITILTMLTVVIIASFGIRVLRVNFLEKYSHVMAEVRSSCAVWG